ncbi:TPA: ATPase, T2SS/T4P/T4SS family, partial [Morganella morganii]
AAIRLALTAAETGHLVLSTLHTRGAIAAIERLTDVFSGAEKNRVCSQMAGSLVAVLSQHLVAKQGGGRCALFDVLINTPAVASLIRDNKAYQIASHQQSGAQSGMMTEEQCLQWRRGRGEIAGEAGAVPAW